MAPEPVRLVSEPMPGRAFMLEMDSRPPKGLLLLPPETRRVRVDAEIALRKVSILSTEQSKTLKTNSNQTHFQATTKQKAVGPALLCPQSVYCKTHCGLSQKRVWRVTLVT